MEGHERDPSPLLRPTPLPVTAILRFVFGRESAGFLSFSFFFFYHHRAPRRPPVYCAPGGVYGQADRMFSPPGDQSLGVHVPPPAATFSTRAESNVADTCEAGHSAAAAGGDAGWLLSQELRSFYRPTMGRWDDCASLLTVFAAVPMHFQPPLVLFEVEFFRVLLCGGKGACIRCGFNASPPCGNTHTHTHGWGHFKAAIRRDAAGGSLVIV